MPAISFMESPCWESIGIWNGLSRTWSLPLRMRRSRFCAMKRRREPLTGSGCICGCRFWTSVIGFWEVFWGVWWEALSRLTPRDWILRWPLCLWWSLRISGRVIGITDRLWWAWSVLWPVWWCLAVRDFSFLPWRWFWRG